MAQPADGLPLKLCLVLLAPHSSLPLAPPRRRTWSGVAPPLANPKEGLPGFPMAIQVAARGSRRRLSTISLSHLRFADRGAAIRASWGLKQSSRDRARSEAASAVHNRRNANPVRANEPSHQTLPVGPRGGRILWLPVGKFPDPIRRQTQHGVAGNRMWDLSCL